MNCRSIEGSLDARTAQVFFWVERVWISFLSSGILSTNENTASGDHNSQTYIHSFQTNSEIFAQYINRELEKRLAPFQ